MRFSAMFVAIFILGELSMTTGCTSGGAISPAFNNSGSILSWGTPTLYTDGSSLTGHIKAYRVYYKAMASNDCTGIISYEPMSHTVIDPNATSVSLSDLITSFNLTQGGNYCVTMTTIDDTDIESDYAVPIFKQIAL